MRGRIVVQGRMCKAVMRGRQAGYGGASWPLCDMVKQSARPDRGSGARPDRGSSWPLCDMVKQSARPDRVTVVVVQVGRPFVLNPDVVKQLRTSCGIAL